MVGEVFVQELAEGQLLDLGEGVNGPERGCRAVFQFDLVVIRAMCGNVVPLLLPNTSINS